MFTNVKSLSPLLLSIDLVAFDHEQARKRALAPNGRFIAVLPSRARHTLPPPTSDAPASKGSNGERFQSITCVPGLREMSFEELRVECYMQALVATGRRPVPADGVANGIAPAFRPWTGPESVEVAREIEMASAV